MKLRSAIKTLLPWIIILAGLITRLWYLDNTPLWYDEAFTRHLAKLPFSQMIMATAGDVHPPAYYVCIWLIARTAGASGFVLRFVSVLFSLLGLVTFFRLTALIKLSPTSRLVALVIFTFHPVAIYYAQEARMYTMLLWLILMQMVCMYRRDWLGLAVFTVAALYTHNYALFYTALIAVVGFFREFDIVIPVYRAGIDGHYPAGVSKLAISIAAPVLLWLPWVYILATQMQAVKDTYWIPPLTLGSISEAILVIMAGINVPKQLLPATTLAIFSGMALLLFYGLKHKHMDLIIFAVGPLAFAVAGSLAWKPILLARGLIGMLIPLSLLAGKALISTDWRGKIIGIALLSPLIVAVLWQVGANYNGLSKGAVINYIYPYANVPVVHLNDSTLILSPKMEGNYLLDAGCPPEAGQLSNITRKAIGYQYIKLDQLPDDYLLSGVIGPLSTSCHEAVYNELTRNADIVYEVVGPLGKYGVFHALR